MTDLNLDADELLHLAINSSEKGEHDKAIDFIKTILDQDPENAQAEYFLGAIYAELHMFDPAKIRIKKAIDLGVNLPTADFQLGLLYATSMQVELAKDAWQPLQKLPENSALYLFQRGLTALLEDRFEDCIDDLTHGMIANSFNEQLNDDMRNVIDEVRKRGLENTSSLAADNSDGNEEQSGAGGERVLLSAYKRQEIDD